MAKRRYGRRQGRAPWIIVGLIGAGVAMLVPPRTAGTGGTAETAAGGGKPDSAAAA